MPTPPPNITGRKFQHGVCPPAPSIRDNQDIRSRRFGVGHKPLRALGTLANTRGAPFIMVATKILLACVCLLPTLSRVVAGAVQYTAMVSWPQALATTRTTNSATQARSSGATGAPRATFAKLEGLNNNLQKTIDEEAAAQGQTRKRSKLCPSRLLAQPVAQLSVLADPSRVLAPTTTPLRLGDPVAVGFWWSA